jgi:hypothetical protein
MAFKQHYRHTQTGWASLITLALIAGLMAAVLLSADMMGYLLVAMAFVLLLGLVFGTMTVQVDSMKISFHFGIGLIRKSVDLADVRTFEAVKNPWYYGWGIHFIPGGKVYNVSGFGAVELRLREGGKRIRIGTDEPEALQHALEQMAGKPEPLTEEEVWEAKRAWVKGAIALTAIIGTSVAAVVVVGVKENEPPVVSVGADTFRVESFLYSEQFPLREITYVGLEPRIPPIRARTNGGAWGGTLRGHFRLDHLGDGMLFIRAEVAPYVLVRRGSDYVIVNFQEPSRTDQLYRELNASWLNAQRR